MWVLFEVVACLPWWIGLTLAGMSYVGLHYLAVREVVPSSIIMAILRGVSIPLQYIIPVGLILSAGISLWRSQNKSSLALVAGEKGTEFIRGLSWKNFEKLIAEVFERQGYSVVHTGKDGPDGGVDVELRKDGELFLVQCKQWKAYKVSVQVARELMGVMASRGAVGGFVVTSGVFTKEAESFAKGTNVQLIDGSALQAMICGLNEDALK